MPYALLNEVYPGADFGSKPMYLDRVESENLGGYGLPIFKNQLTDNYYNQKETSSSVKKILPPYSPETNAKLVPGKEGGGFRVQPTQEPSGAVYLNDYQSLDTAFGTRSPLGETAPPPHRPGSYPLRRSYYMEKSNNGYPTGYAGAYEQSYASFMTPALEEQLARETEKVSCHNLFIHLRNCQDCSSKVKKMLVSSKEYGLGFGEVAEGFSPYNNNSIIPFVRFGDILEIVLYIALGVLSMFILNTFLKLGAVSYIRRKKRN